MVPKSTVPEPSPESEPMPHIDKEPLPDLQTESKSSEPDKPSCAPLENPPELPQEYVTFVSCSVQTTAPSACRRFCNYQIRRPIKSNQHFIKSSDQRLVPEKKPTSYDAEQMHGSSGSVASTEATLPHDNVPKDASGSVACTTKGLVPHDKPAKGNQPMIHTKQLVPHDKPDESSLMNKPKTDLMASTPLQSKESNAPFVVVKPKQTASSDQGNSRVDTKVVKEEKPDERLTVTQPRVESPPRQVLSAAGNLQVAKPVVQSVHERHAAELNARLERLIQPESVRAKHSHRPVAKKHSRRSQKIEPKKDQPPAKQKLKDPKAEHTITVNPANHDETNPEPKRLLPSSPQIEAPKAKSISSELPLTSVGLDDVTNADATHGSTRVSTETDAAQLLKNLGPTPTCKPKRLIPTPSRPKSLPDVKSLSRLGPNRDVDLRKDFVSPPKLGELGTSSGALAGSLYIDVASEEAPLIASCDIGTPGSESATKDGNDCTPVEKGTTSSGPEPYEVPGEPGNKQYDFSTQVNRGTSQGYPNILQAISQSSEMATINEEPVERAASVLFIHQSTTEISVSSPNHTEIERPASVQVVHQKTTQVTMTCSSPTERHSSKKSSQRQADEDGLTVLGGDDVTVLPQDDITVLQDSTSRNNDDVTLLAGTDNDVTVTLQTRSLAGARPNKTTPKQPTKARYNTRAKPQDLTPALGSTPPRPVNRDAHPIPEDSIYPCDHCDEVFRSAISYNLHQPLHSTVQTTFKHYCCICTKGFNNRFAYNEHENRCKGISFDCHKCGRNFYHKERLRAHVQAAHGLFICRECGKVFLHNSRLLVHERDEHQLYSVDD